MWNNFTIVVFRDSKAAICREEFDFLVHLDIVRMNCKQKLTVVETSVITGEGLSLVSKWISDNTKTSWCTDAILYIFES